jgi:hypothetical protein
MEHDEGLLICVASADNLRALAQIIGETIATDRHR